MVKDGFEFYGSTTVGERGQIVVPIEGRDSLDLKPGDQLLVFKAPFKDALVVVKPEAFARHIKHMSDRASQLKKYLDETRRDDGGRQ